MTLTGLKSRSILFSPAITEAVGHYVYVLLDENNAFYVGKGQGNRAFQHAADELDLEEDETPETTKLQQIRDIRRGGRQVRVLLLRHGMKTNEEAFRLESLVIELSMAAFSFDLKNIVAGHHVDAEGIMSPDEVIALYGASPIQLDDTPLIMFRIPKLWHRGMSDLDLYEATRGGWRLDIQRVQRAKYVLSVSKGVVRQVYRPESWRARTPDEAGWGPDELTRPRYGFEGVVADDAPAGWRNHNVLLPPGFQGPFRYHNC